LVALNISADTPRRLASLGIKHNDLWLHDNLVYMATEQGVEVVRLTKDDQFEPVTRFAIQNGAQHISGDSRQLYVSSGKSILSLKRGLLMEQISEFKIDSEITGLNSSNDQLFISTTNELISLDTRSIDKPQLISRYPLLSNSSAITYHQDVIYLSGEETIIALRPMPNMQQQTRGLAEIALHLPENLAIGSYNLAIHYQDGSEEIVEHAIRVEMPRFSKPKLNMDDFKKLLEQQKQNRDLFTGPAINNE